MNDCSICMESGFIGTGNCKCKTMYYHKRCLDRWRRSKPDPTTCEICEEPYTTTLENRLLYVLSGFALLGYSVLGIIYLFQSVE